MFGNVVKILIRSQERAIVLHGGNSDLTVNRRGRYSFGCAVSVQLCRSDVISPLEFNDAERSKKVGDPVKLIIGPESLQYFLQY